MAGKPQGVPLIPACFAQLRRVGPADRGRQRVCQDQPCPSVTTLRCLDRLPRHPPGPVRSGAIQSFHRGDRIAQAHQDERVASIRMDAQIMVFCLEREQTGAP